MKYGVRISDLAEFELDAGPSTPPLRSVSLDFEAGTQMELELMVEALGFDPLNMKPTERLHVRYGVPLTCEGEEVGRCDVHLWIGEELGGVKAAPPIEALVRLRENAEAISAIAADAP